MPSKGRLQENAAAFFARAGLEFVQGRGARDYRGAIAGLPGVEVAFLSASEIVGQLAAGAAHFGVTGEDLVREKVPDADARLELLAPLGFGRADVVVAAPKAWIDVRTMADLEDVASAFRARRGERMRVATKYVNLTRRYFAEHGVGDYRIVESLGATEGAPAAGAAELIVDITTTGATLAANALKPLEDGADPALAGDAGRLARRALGAEPRARAPAPSSTASRPRRRRARSREVRARLPRPAHRRRRRGARDASAPFRPSARSRSRRASSRCHCAKAEAADLAELAARRRAPSASASAALEQVFDARNPLYEALERRIGAVAAFGGAGRQRALAADTRPKSLDLRTLASIMTNSDPCQTNASVPDVVSRSASPRGSHGVRSGQRLVARALV